MSVGRIDRLGCLRRNALSSALAVNGNVRVSNVKHSLDLTGCSNTTYDLPFVTNSDLHPLEIDTSHE